jgi:asparagine synthase (glutamine-hydrolysing)
MRDSLRHRGPDDCGYWAEGPVALGHRRLAILDLSREGHQPMVSSDGRFVICYNGEVYNYRALGRALESAGYQFRGHSDTEVMLAGFMHWGVAEAVRRFVGMFAFALWDRREHALHLVRDRIGIKPLHLARTVDGDLLFASELKAIVAHPAFDRTLDRSALTAYLRYTYVPAPRTVYRDAVKIPPGHILSLASPEASWTAAQPYWSLEDIAERSRAHPFDGDESEAVSTLDSLVREAVGLRMIADVPLGAFLSGGIDSSLVVAQMQAQSCTRVRTFTIGFGEPRFDESPFARTVASQLGTDHTELVVSAADARAVIPELPQLYDEPFADASQIPTYLVSRLARSEVTVSLSGDGGDELFAGYERYRFAHRLWPRLAAVPMPLRRLSAVSLRGLSPCWQGAAFGQAPGAADRMDKLADLCEAPSPEAAYHRLVSTTRDPRMLVLGDGEQPGELERLLTAQNAMQPVERMLLADTMVYLPDDLLTKLDRASMAVSLEGRVPLLDHRVVEFAWTLPLGFKLRNGSGKWLLKEVLRKYLPRSVVARPKMGFEVPIGEWLRGPLRPWADQLLEPQRLRAGGVFKAEPVVHLWARHRSGRGDSTHLLWSVLMFEAWRDSWRAAA